MTMFQILTQKGWLDIMHSTMRQSKGFSPLVAVYFISYHLFVTLVKKTHKIDKELLNVVRLTVHYTTYLDRYLLFRNLYCPSGDPLLFDHLI
jgi:hypothetical protein